MDKTSGIYLAIAILGEICATSALKGAQGFTRLWPSVVVVVGYSAAFYSLSLALKHIPVGLAYAIWSCVGTVLVTLAAWVLYDQKISPLGWVGMALIVAGTTVVNMCVASHH